MHVGVGHAAAHRADRLAEFARRNALRGRADHVGGGDDAGDAVPGVGGQACTPAGVGGLARLRAQPHRDAAVDARLGRDGYAPGSTLPSSSGVGAAGNAGGAVARSRRRGIRRVAPVEDGRDFLGADQYGFGELVVFCAMQAHACAGNPAIANRTCVTLHVLLLHGRDCAACEGARDARRADGEMRFRPAAQTAVVKSVTAQRGAVAGAPRAAGGCPPGASATRSRRSTNTTGCLVRRGSVAVKRDADS